MPTTSRYGKLLVWMAVVSLVASIPTSLFVGMVDALYCVVWGMALMLYVCLLYVQDVAAQMQDALSLIRKKE